MFEGIVQKLLLEYLGRYVKDIQKEQLKIGLWNGEVLLEKVELILEAFDYLQLPFALKQGRVGRLSIKIPWKKLGWDPIIIYLEDVFICACQREDHEWSLDPIEKREYAWKKAKLAAAELAKLSRRVCDNQAGQSFTSYITAKILDGIQVSIKNVHVKCINGEADSEKFVFGLRLSSLTMKQNPIWSSSSKIRGGQVNKVVEISELGIYCRKSEEAAHWAIADYVEPLLLSNAEAISDKNDYILAPFDVALSLVVNRSGKVENGVPQYSIFAELTALVLLLNEVQIQQILILWDYLSIYQLREKYGRFRPCHNSLLKKLNGWQRMWWQYAQKSVLSDVRRRLRKTSWSYLCWRMSHCRKYVNLYKKKLGFLRQEQPVDKSILLELEQMEKESDIEDILSYRSIAECESQELLFNFTSSNVGKNDGSITSEKQQNDEGSSVKSRGWLNWLSLGMLGAGGTEDSIQFSGVVSDEVIKDIYEVTEFHPASLVDGSTSTKCRIYSSIKFNVHRTVATLFSKMHGKEAVKMISDEVIIECKHSEESCTFTFLVNSLEVSDPCSNNIVLFTRQSSVAESTLENQPSIIAQLDMFVVKCDTELSVKVLFQPIEVVYDSSFLLNLYYFLHVLGSYKFHHERVVLSLNGFENVKTRISSKAEYTLSHRVKIFWDVTFSTILVQIPWRCPELRLFMMRLEIGAISFKSSIEAQSVALDKEHRQTCFPYSQWLESIDESLEDFGFQDLFDCFEVSFTDFEVNVVLPYCNGALPLFERFDASISLASCIILDESELEQLEVLFTLSPLDIHFSPSIYGAILGMIQGISIPKREFQSVIQDEAITDDIYPFSITAKFDSVGIHANITDDRENDLVLNLILGQLQMAYAYRRIVEYNICLKTLNISMCSSQSHAHSDTLCSSRDITTGNSCHDGMRPRINISSNSYDQGEFLADGCFLVHYQAQKSGNLVCHKYRLWLNDLDFHFHPDKFGLLLRFFNKLAGYGAYLSAGPGMKSLGSKTKIKDEILMSSFGLHGFGFSNYHEAESKNNIVGIPLDHFPFITIHDSGTLGNLEESLIHGIPEWRKALKVWNKKSTERQKSMVEKRSPVSTLPTLEDPHCERASPVIGNCCYNADMFVFELNMNRIKAHFHDASCILATITLPISKSSFILYDSDYFDMLWSFEGLLLTSSWSTQDYHDFLWGSSVPNLSNVLNIRLRKENNRSLTPQIEVNTSIQHVSCVLPVDFLAILIGYFSLPDWTSSGSQPCVVEGKEREDSDNNCSVVYKFEILDSLLIMPLNSSNYQSLNFELQQLYCSFRPGISSECAFRDVPSECLVSTHKVQSDFHLLNVFGRDIYLSLVLHKDADSVAVNLDQDGGHGNNTRHANISLIAPMNTDIWIRIPYGSNCSCEQSAPMCIMINIQNCQIIAEDDYFIFGVEAVLIAINQLSSVGAKSEGFTSDVLHFLQFNKSLEDGILVQPIVSSVSFTEIKCYVNSLSLILCRVMNSHAGSLRLIAKADMQFNLSASFRDDILLELDMGFSYLSLHSMCTSSSLIECKSEGPTSSGLLVHLSISDQGVNVLHVDLSSAHIWLHLFDWSEVIEVLLSYSRKLFGTSLMNASKTNSNLVGLVRNNQVTLHSDSESPRTSSSAASKKMNDSVNFIMKSENIIVSFHFPLSAKKETFDKCRKAGEPKKIPSNVSLDIIREENMHKYIAVVLHIKDCDLAINGPHAKLKCYVERIKGITETIQDQRILSWLLFEIFQVHVVAEVCDKQQKQHVDADIRIDRLDFWSSRKILYFWHDIEFKIPQAESSQISFFSMVIKVHLRKTSMLLTDGRWSCEAPLLEMIVRNFLLHINTTDATIEASAKGDLVVNYNNIHTVKWEPFIEPWSLELTITRKHRQSALVKTFMTTDIHLKSMTQLNLNFTEPLIEVIFRINELIKDVKSQIQRNDHGESHGLEGCQASDDLQTRYAPYILQNETSLPLSFQVHHGLVHSDNSDILTMKEGNIVQPGSSIPIYIDETPEEHALRLRSPQSSDRLNDESVNGVAHMISIKLDGTSGPSKPISMDIVGLSYFEVNFSKASEKTDVEKQEVSQSNEDKNRKYPNSGYVVPVVFDVSIWQYSKLIRLYSTVILLNSTSMPLELRFDIPFGVSPKVLDPIYPGQEFPLPLHLAEAGMMRWRPLGSSYLWSEAQLLSNILSLERKPGFLRSFVCYPLHPSNDPFRCCISIQSINLSSTTGPKEHLSCVAKNSRESFDKQDHRGHSEEDPKKRFIHCVTLTTPLLVRNYLPHEISLTVESGGITRTIVLSEAGSASIFNIDSTHDLGLVFHVNEFSSGSSKFPRAEAFATIAKLHDTKFSLSERIAIYPDSSQGPVYINVEKVLDAFCGARELCISVPFLLYNCTGLPLTIASSGNEIEGNSCNMPSCYHLMEFDKLLSRKHGLGLVPSGRDLHICSPTSKNHYIPLRDNVHLHGQMSPRRNIFARDSHANSVEHCDRYGSFTNLGNKESRRSNVEFFDESDKEFDYVDCNKRNARACMYSPHPSSSAAEVMVQLSLGLPKFTTENAKNLTWSSPFFLVPPSGSTTITVPKTVASGAFIISATSNLLAGPFSGRTRAITFQPRYVISNACSKDICYKQKGTDFVSLLGVGEHSHLHLDDTTRDLLVSLRFNEPGWLWSGSFFPDHLGDTQVKMRNYVSGALNMIRVEIQNADIPIRNERIVGNSLGKSGTLLILLSDDNTGFMPYRIDNFSMERLRVYQEKCETFETIVHTYTSCPYAWDEPSFPLRLVVEVLGECILGYYSLDEVKEQTSVYLPSTSEKPGRHLFLAIHAEGAIKVLSIIDSRHHLMKDIKETSFAGFKEKKNLDQKKDTLVEFTERLSVHFSFIGISLINSIPQELLFVSAKDTKIDILQNMEQQKLFFHLSSLQIDNQLTNATYPVILSFDHDYGSDSARGDSLNFKSGKMAHISSPISCEPRFSLAAAKWRNKEISLVSFEYISLRLAPLQLELEEEVILCLLDFFKTIMSRLKRTKMPCPGREFHHPVHENCSSPLLPSAIPIGAPWQQIYLLARRQKKIYVEVLDLSPIKLTLSFSSAPWMPRNEGPTYAESLGYRGLMALADVEGAPVHLRQLVIDHHMGSWESFQDILIRHYTWQLLHDTYKIFGSAGVMGNPMGFARNLGLGIKDFLSVPARGIFQSPSGLITGMAQGTSSLVSNTVYAVSNAATQFSKSAHKSIVAFTFDDQMVSRMEKQQKGSTSQSKGVLHEFLEGLTGFLQSPVRGAEKHGLAGVVSGIALGTAGLVARPVASILEVTGKTAQSIRNRSSLHRPHHFRVRFPRPLSKEFPLRPYSWEEAIGTSMLLEVSDAQLKDEKFVKCKTLQKAGSFVIITKRLILVVTCPNLVGLGTSEFRGVAADPQWLIEVEMGLDRVIHLDREKQVLNIVGSKLESLLKQHQQRKGTPMTKWDSTSLPLFQMNVEFRNEEEAEEVLQVILSTIENIKERGLDVHTLHQSDVGQKKSMLHYYPSSFHVP